MRCYPWLLVAVLASSGCLGSSPVECADGSVCPQGYVCRTGGGCDLQEAITVCEGQADLAACNVAGIREGVCASGVCVATGCGNGITEPDEACDDGNTLSLDGCSSDCRSNESCGNNVVDPLAAEQCDYGAGLSGDGCSSSCLLETPSWQVWTPPHSVVPLANFQMAYDQRREQVVVLAQLDNSLQTWVGDGHRWMLASSTLPSPIATIAYDETRGHVIAVSTFGEISDEVPRTYEFIGGKWVFVPTEHTPTLKPGAAMIYDGTRQRLVLFGGGSESSANLNETWIFQGGDWSRLSPSVSPPPRFKHAMAYDVARDRVVLYGGKSGNAQRADTWEFDGSNWREIVTLTDPGSAPFSATYDPIRKAVVMMGAGTWAFIGGNWQPLPTLAGNKFALAYDPHRGAIMAATSVGSSGSLVGPLFLSSLGGGWNRANFEHQYREFAVAVYDRRRGRVLQFSGGTFDDGFAASNRLASFDGNGWSFLTPPTAPPARAVAAGAYDIARDKVVIFGGTDEDFNLLDDTWLFDGTTWTQHAGPGPDARNGMVMAYDSLRGKTVLFGGREALAGVYLSDTWEFDGFGWQLIKPAAVPPPRSDGQLAYDESRGIIVLYGGRNNTRALGDTWIFDGTTWTEIPTEREEISLYGSMAYDSSRGAVVRYGGQGSNAHYWFDGSRWQEVYYQQGQPPAYENHTLVFDERRGRMLAFGANNAGDEVLEMRLDSPTPDSQTPEENCTTGLDDDGDGLAGCADPDCWGVCTPTCAPWTSCDPTMLPGTTPHCGDGVCDLVLETGTVCPQDCDDCGDGRCALGFENPTNCAADCQSCGDGLCEGFETDLNCPGDCTV